MEPEIPPETTETIDLTTLESLLESIKLNQETQHQEMVALTTELVAANYHIRQLNNDIVVGLGFLIASIILWKIVKLVF